MVEKIIFRVSYAAANVVIASSIRWIRMLSDITVKRIQAIIGPLPRSVVNIFQRSSINLNSMA